VAVRKRGVRLCEKNNSADAKVSEKGGGGGAPGARAESLSLQPVMKTMVRQAVPCSPWRSKVEQISTCSPWKGPHARAGGCLKEAVTPWGAHAGAGSWQDLRTRGKRSPRQSKFAGRARDPRRDPRWSSLFLKDCAPWEGPTLGQFVKSCSPWEGLLLEKFVQNCLS